MTGRIFALKLHDDNVTPMEVVVDQLIALGHPRKRAIELMVAVHTENGFHVAFGTETEMAASKANFDALSHANDVPLQTVVEGPFDVARQEAWEAEIARRMKPLPGWQRALWTLLVGAAFILWALVLVRWLFD